MVTVDSRADDCPRAASLFTEAKQLIKPDGSQSIEAEAKLREAISFCPSLADAHYELGFLLESRGERVLARQSFHNAHSHGKDSRFARALGRTQILLKEFADAEKTYQQLLSDEPKQVNAYHGLAMCYRGTGKLSEAEAVLRRGLQYAPDNGDLFFNLAVVLEELGRSDEAIISYRTSLERKTSAKQASYYLSRLLFKAGRLEEAKKSIEKALLEDSGDPGVLLTAAAIEDAIGNHSDALNLLTKAKDSNSGQSNRMLELNEALVLAKMGKLDKSLSKLLSLVESAPGDSQMHAALGWVYLLKDEHELAEKSLRRAIEIDSTNSVAQKNLETLLERMQVTKLHLNDG